MARRTKAEAEATRDAILDAAEQEFLSRGVSRTTIDHIARRAKVTRGAVYWHFKDKAHVFSDLLDRVRLPLDELSNRYREGVSDRDPLGLLENLCTQGLIRLKDHETYRNVYTVLFTRCEFIDSSNPSCQKQLKIDDEIHERFTADFDLAARLGHLKPGVDARIAALSLFNLIHGVYYCWLKTPERFDILDDGIQMLKLFFNGVQCAPEGNVESVDDQQGLERAKRLVSRK